MLNAYLDIETTGLSWFYHEITVIGIYLIDGSGSRLVQLVGEQVERKGNIFVLDGGWHL